MHLRENTHLMSNISPQIQWGPLKGIPEIKIILMIDLMHSVSEPLSCFKLYSIYAWLINNLVKQNPSVPNGDIKTVMIGLVMGEW